MVVSGDLEGMGPKSGHMVNAINQEGHMLRAALRAGDTTGAGLTIVEGKEQKNMATEGKKV